MAGVEAGELVVGHQDAVSEAGLLAEDDGFFVLAKGGVDLGVGDVAFAQAAVGAVVVGER